MRANTPEDFWAKVRKDPDGCWRWTACLDRDGYAAFKMRGKNYRGHKLAYELIVGPIPDGMELDHTCRVRCCVRPDHVEPVTGLINQLRGETVIAANAAKTHCPKGHPLSGENLIPYYVKRGHRACRECGRKRSLAITGR
jgi:hypothetical protein